jgi:hypothetical protein
VTQGPNVPQRGANLSLHSVLGTSMAMLQASQQWYLLQILMCRFASA